VVLKFGAGSILLFLTLKLEVHLDTSVDWLLLLLVQLYYFVLLYIEQYKRQTVRKCLLILQAALLCCEMLLFEIPRVAHWYCSNVTEKADFRIIEFLQYVFIVADFSMNCEWRE
jgi:hypothetical protein